MHPTTVAWMKRRVIREGLEPTSWYTRRSPFRPDGRPGSRSLLTILIAPASSQHLLLQLLALLLGFKPLSLRAARRRRLARYGIGAGALLLRRLLTQLAIVKLALMSLLLLQPLVEPAPFQWREGL